MLVQTSCSQFNNVSNSGQTHSAGSYKLDARQPRLAMEADVTSDKKTRKRMEGVAATE